MAPHAEVLERHELPVVTEDDVVIVRRKVKELADARQFNPFAAAAITTTASELSRNMWVHAGGGVATVEEISSDGRIGLRLQFRDQGPGIANVESALKGGVSTSKSLGLGLSGSRRLVDEFQLESTVGRGTVVTVVKWKKPF